MIRRRQATVALAALAAATRSIAQPEPLAALQLVGIDGRNYRLAGGAPRARVLNLWARWCAPCRRELPSLQRLAARLDAERIELLTIAIEDDRFALREYLRDIGFTRPVLPLRPAELPAELRVPGLPLTLALAADGRVLARVAGAREWDTPGVADALLAPLRRGG